MSDWPIPVTTKTVHTIDAFDLERLVNNTYSLNDEWSFVANEECGNDSDHKFSTERELLSFQQKHLEEFKAGDVYACQFSTGTVLKDLADQGLIPHGDILVSVRW